MQSMKVLLHKDAAKKLSKMDAAMQDRIKRAIAGLGKEPPEGDIRPYAGSKNVMRLKVGGYRVLWKVVDNMILVTHIVPRGQAYTKGTKTGR